MIDNNKFKLSTGQVIDWDDENKRFNIEVKKNDTNYWRSKQLSTERKNG